ncbi:peptidylprolyl isomerase [Candidatus Pelagibacter sp.]|nr:peptidylprolyl isomerase [Candidatus Pelagibacter sp.]
MNRKVIFFIFVFFFLNTKSNSNEQIFISYKIENEIITNIDIRNEAKYLLALNNQLKELTNKKLLEIAEQSIVKEKIKKIELLKYYPLDQKSPYLDNIIQDFYLRINLKSLQEFENYLSKYDLKIKTIKKKLEIEASWNQLIYEKYVNQISINEDLLIKKIKEMKKSNKKISFLLSEIVFEIKENKSLDDVFLDINNSLTEIGFKNTANLFSLSESSKFGGNIGWINEDGLSQKILKALKKIKIGDITSPIQLNNNYLLLKIMDTKEVIKKINEKEELKKLKLLEQNRKLENFSKIYFNKVKINTAIDEL